MSVQQRLSVLKKAVCAMQLSVHRFGKARQASRFWEDFFVLEEGDAERSLPEDTSPEYTQVEFEKKYNPQQPRHPKGRSDGGRWRSRLPDREVADRASAFAQVNSAYLRALRSHGVSLLDGERVINALDSYVQGSYQINSALRRGRVPREAKYLDMAFVPISKPVTVWRGLSISKARFQKIMSSKSFKDLGYVSTSTKRATAVRFTDGFNEDAFLLKINVPRGSKVAVPKGLILTDEGESEVILPRGSKFVPKAYTYRKGTHVLSVDLVSR